MAMNKWLDTFQNSSLTTGRSVMSDPTDLFVKDGSYPPAGDTASVIQNTFVSSDFLQKTNRAKRLHFWQLENLILLHFFCLFTFPI